MARLAVAGSTGVNDWSVFYDEHFDFVWRSLRRLGVPEASLDDAAQEVFLVAFRRAKEFEGRSSVRTWLFGIAWNRARELLRGARRRPEEPLPDVLPAAPRADQEQTAIEREALRFAYRVLDELAPERRAVLVMVDVEEMTGVEIAEILRVPVNTVYSRVRQLREGLRRMLGEEEVRRG